MVGAATCMLSALSEGKAGLNSSTRRREAQVRSSERLTRCRPPFPQSSACTLSLSPLPSPFLGTVPIWACSSRGKHWNDWLCMLLRLASPSREQNPAVSRSRPDQRPRPVCPRVSPPCRQPFASTSPVSIQLHLYRVARVSGVVVAEDGDGEVDERAAASTRTDHLARPGATTALDVWVVARRGQKMLRIRSG